MNYLPVLKEFCQFAIDSSGLHDLVQIRLESNTLLLESRHRQQRLIWEEEQLIIIDTDTTRHCSPKLAEIAAAVIAKHVQDALCEAIQEEYGYCKRSEQTSGMKL